MQVLDLGRHVSNASVDTVGRALSRRCEETHPGNIKSCSCAIVNSTWHVLAYSLLQQKERPCSSKHTTSRGCGCRRSMCRPGVLTTGCVRPTCLRDREVSSRANVSSPTCLREVSSRAHVSSPTRLKGGVFGRPRVFAATWVFDGLRQTCLREVSSPAQVSSRRRVSSPDLSSGSFFARPRVFTTARVFARPVFGTGLHAPRVFATTRVLAGPVFRTRLCTPTCLRDACLCPTCLRQLSSHTHTASLL